jgi:hypothetical protein
MIDWPTEPFIRVIRGTVDGCEITGEFAYRQGGNRYGVLSSKRQCETIALGYYGDSITEWEEVAFVPVSALKRLRDERGRETSLHNLRAAIDDVLEALPADKPDALTRAVTRVKDANDTPTVDADTPIEERLSLLLESLASIQSATHKGALLITVARICADWLHATASDRDGLEDIEASAREITTIPDGTEERYLSLTYRFAQVATLIGEGDHGSLEIIRLGAYALAWATQIIEEEES